MIFGLFNYIFVGGFFKTAYNFGKPFVLYVVVAFLVIILAEVLHLVPGFENINAFGVSCLGLQLVLLLGGVLIYILLTFFAYHISQKRFERIDL